MAMMWSEKISSKPERPRDGFDELEQLEKGETRPGKRSLATARRSNQLDEHWMAKLDDDVLVSSLSIPGTHDSAAYTSPLPFVSTQTMDITQQLNAGVRYFDFRCGIRDDLPVMVHGPTLLGTKLLELLDIMYHWLDQHPKEGLIVQIKEDRKPDRSTVDFSNAVFKCISARSDRWRTANTTPSLGELRGKIQLFRRYRGPSLTAYGIDVTEWQDNPEGPFTINTRNSVQLTIQDHYSFSDPTPLPSLIAIKGGDISGLLDRAAADPDPGHWYMNFTSAYEFNWYYQLPPREVAVGGYAGFRWEDGINPRVRTYFATRTDSLRKGRRNRFGIVAMDFPDIGSEDLISVVIRSNFKKDKKAYRAWCEMVAAETLLCLILLGMMWIVLAHLPGQFSTWAISCSTGLFDIL